MSDIFISYATADRPRAAALAQALQARGWAVWWDRVIPPGRQFDEVIDEALTGAGCVVVLWSKASAASTWVKTEAAEAFKGRKLIPALIEPAVTIPLEFRRLQAADLTHWVDGQPSPEFEQFCTAIAHTLGSPHPPVPPPPPPPPPPQPPVEPVKPPPAPPSPPSHKARNWTIGIAVFGVIGLAQQYLEQRGRLIDSGQSSPVSQGSTSNNANTNANGNTSAADNTDTPHAVPALRMQLRWRDYILSANGQLQWDGQSDTAQLSANISDGRTSAQLGRHQLEADVTQVGPSTWRFDTDADIPGDSQTPGPHRHHIGLVLQLQAGGTWVFLENCMAPGNCYR